MKPNNNKKTLVLLAAVFILPVLAAKFVLSMNWYQGAATNRGELLPSHISYQSLSMTNPAPHKWQLVYLLPEYCDSSCQQQLYLLQQTHLALGKEQDRVVPVVLLNDNSDRQALASFSFTTTTVNTELQQQLNPHQIIIADPLGKLVSRYTIPADAHASLMQGKALMQDLRKMLKLSRVG